MLFVCVFAMDLNMMDALLLDGAVCEMYDDIDKEMDIMYDEKCADERSVRAARHRAVLPPPSHRRRAERLRLASPTAFAAEGLRWCRALAVVAERLRWHRCRGRNAALASHHPRAML